MSGGDCNTMMSSITNKTRRNWSDLQSELLELILRRLALADIARFKVVCSFWNAAAKSYTSGPGYKPLLPQTPWLMLPQEREDVDAGSFFSLSEKKVYTFRNLFQGFSEDEKYLLGSSYGWLLISDFKTKKSVHLLNPISRVRIILPPLGFKVRRVLLSSDPSCSKTFNVELLILSVEQRQWTLAFHKHGDDDGNHSSTWTYLDDAHIGFLDNVIFHKNLLYGLSFGLKSISVWDFGGAYPIKTIDNFLLPEREVRGPKVTCPLVESLGEILLVDKLLSRQVSYEVHKLNITPNKVEFLKVECLEERALVLSEDQPTTTTISLSTVDFPELEANSIYVAEKLYCFTGEVVSNVNAYNLESKGLKTCYTSQRVRSQSARLDSFRQHLWIVPNLWIVPSPCLV